MAEVEGAEDVLGMRAHTVRCGHDDDGDIQRAETPLDLSGKVDVTGGVDDIDGLAVPPERRGRRADRDASLPLDGQRIGACAAVVHTARLPDTARREQHPLRQRGFSGVHVRKDTQIQKCTRWHGLLLVLL